MQQAVIPSALHVCIDTLTPHSSASMHFLPRAPSARPCLSSCQELFRRHCDPCCFLVAPKVTLSFRCCAIWWVTFCVLSIFRSSRRGLSDCSLIDQHSLRRDVGYHFVVTGHAIDHRSLWQQIRWPVYLACSDIIRKVNEPKKVPFMCTCDAYERNRKYIIFELRFDISMWRGGHGSLYFTTSTARMVTALSPSWRERRVLYR